MNHILPKLLIIAYIAIMINYGVQKDWGRVIYWLGATIIVCGTILIK